MLQDQSSPALDRHPARDAEPRFERNPTPSERGIPVPQRKPHLRDAVNRNERIAHASEDEVDGEPSTYHPPQSPDEDNPFVLALKVSASMALAYAVAGFLGFTDLTWSVLTAAFLATSPLIASGHAAMKKVVALGIGLALGTVGALAASWFSSVPVSHIALVGVVAGLLGSRSPDYLFAAVVGTVVTFVGTGGGDPLGEVVTATMCMVLIGCAVGPAVVWVIERVRRAQHARKARA